MFRKQAWMRQCLSQIEIKLFHVYLQLEYDWENTQVLSVSDSDVKFDIQIGPDWPRMEQIWDFLSTVKMC